MHRAFVDEPFNVEMYGPDLLTRWAGSWALFQGIQRDEYAIALGAHVGEAIVGVLVGSLPGHCHVCDVVALTPQPSDPLDAIDWQFHQNIAVVHAPLGPHAWVSKVTVEPALHGLGIGRILLKEAYESFRVAAPTILLLECQPHRQGFYESAGFEPVTTFPDPAGPDALLMRRDVH